MSTVAPLDPKRCSHTVETNQRKSNGTFIMKDPCLTCVPPFLHLQSGDKAAQVRRVDEAKAKDTNVVTVKCSNVT